ncbi:MAG: rod shape-determining protein [Clostridia bacterium]|nr:rod shape-determining protein [Clostridia bacterium]
MAIDIGIDLGSANTLFFLKDKGIILSSPTVISTDTVSGKDLCFGSQAKKMLGKTPKNIKVSRPVREGVISDMDDTVLLLSRLLEKTELVSFFSRPNAYACVPTKSTEVEKRAVQEAIYTAGTKNVTLVQKPLAAAIGAGLRVLSAKGCMIVDIGEGTAESAVISLGEIVVSRLQRVAGSSLDKAIINYFYDDRRIEIGELTAERLKIKLGTANAKIDRGEAPVFGRNLNSGMAIASTATSKEILYAIKPVLNSIVQQIRLTLEATPPELTSDVCNNGIILTGGGALLPGIAEYISSELKIKVSVAPKPLESVCVGIGKMIESSGELNRMLYRN